MMPHNAKYLSKLKKDHSPQGRVTKLFMVFGILVAPIVISAVALYPLVKASNNQRYSGYKLPEGFTRVQIDTIIAKMHQDPEFQFYFNILGWDSTNRVAESVYQILDKSRDKAKHLQEIKILQERIQASAAALNEENFPSAFINDPMAHPELVRKFWDFVSDEFRLTIIGLCYKSTYDADFQFEWNASTRQAAQRMEKILYSLSDEQRKQIEQSLNTL